MLDNFKESHEMVLSEENFTRWRFSFLGNYSDSFSLEIFQLKSEPLWNSTENLVQMALQILRKFR